MAQESQPTECFLKHLEETLGCRVPFNVHQSFRCPECQFPFVYNNKSHENCITEDAAQPWCPVSTYLNGKAVENSWEFCSADCSNDIQNDPINVQETELICESKDMLHQYLQLFQDKSRTNPRIIAENLNRMSCPFKCQYKEYLAQLVYKKHDKLLDNDTVHLIIEFDSKTDIQKSFRNLLYTTDMFVSDIGSVFGILLGMSLIDLISFIFRALAAISLAMRRSSKKEGVWLSLYAFLKWTSTLCFIIWIIYSTVSQEFVNLLPKIFESEVETEINEWVSLDEAEFEIGFFQGIVP